MKERQSQPRGLIDLGIADYGNPIAEAQRCRRRAALFDFSFIRRAAIRGPGCEQALMALQQRDVAAMAAGDIRYALRCAPRSGAVVADMTIWKTAADAFEVYSGRQQDIDDLAMLMRDPGDYTDLSESSRIFALQGPQTLAVLSSLTEASTITRLKYYQHCTCRIAGYSCRIGRLGYTGEAGVEIIIEGRQPARAIWQLLAEAASPAGMLAADILRIEAGFILFLNECRLGVTPSELGLRRFAGDNSASDRYQLVCFNADGDDYLLPWRAPSTLQPPGPGQIAITSANRARGGQSILGLGLVRTHDNGNTAFNDPQGHFRQIRRCSLPFYDQRKIRPKIDWTR